jgi:hypothetical protein
MTITLTTADPTDDATGLTAGASYSVWHSGHIIVTATIDGVEVRLHDARADGPSGFVLQGIPATTLTFTLGPGSTAAKVEITAIL